MYRRVAPDIVSTTHTVANELLRERDGVILTI